MGGIMSGYLSEPIREKVSVDNSTECLSYGASSMQGWRIEQEDAHNCCPEFDPDTGTALFGVYDGHGGAEVAQYVALYYPDFLRQFALYKENSLDRALEESFLTFDGTLVTESALTKLNQLAGNSKEDDDEEIPPDPVTGEIKTVKQSMQEETQALHEEADMPIEELVQRYGGEQTMNRIKALKSKPPAKNGKFQSPMLHSKSESKECASTGTGEEDIKMKLEDKLVNGHETGSVEKKSDEAAIQSEDKCNDKSDEDKVQSRSSTGSASTVDNNTSFKVENSVPASSESGQSSDVTERSEADSTQGGDESHKPAKTENAELNTVSKQGLHFDNQVSSSSGANGSNTETVSSGPVRPSTAALGEGSSSTSSRDDAAATGCTGAEEGGASSSAISTEDAGPSSSTGVTIADLDDEEWSTDDSEDEDAEVNESDDEEDESGNECGDGEEEEEEEEDYHDVMSSGEEPGYDSGTTAVVALLRGNELHVGNAGDSRCVLCRAGKAVDMSVDHKPEDDIEQNRIMKAGGRVTMDGRVNGGLNLSRAIGDHVYKQITTLGDREQMITALPDIRSVTLGEDDEFMILACDGIWNVMTSQDAVDFVWERLKKPDVKLSEICEEMFEFCLAPDTTGDGTGCDNMTCIIVKFSQDSLASGAKRPADTSQNPSDENEKLKAKKARTQEELEN